MSQRHLGMRLLVTAITALLTASLAGFSGLVLCVGTDGHRAIEVEHAATACPTLAGSQDGPGIATQAPAECFDLPSAGSGPAMPSSADDPTSPVAFLAGPVGSTPRVAARLPGSIDARCGPRSRALHLASTVLLV